jgi:hypothetical protein
VTRRTLAAEQIRLASLMLPAVDCLLRAMAAEGVHDPVTTLRVLLVRNPAIEQDEVARRYGHMVRAIRATFTYQNNSVMVEAAIERCISISESLL